MAARARKAAAKKKTKAVNSAKAKVTVKKSKTSVAPKPKPNANANKRVSKSKNSTPNEKLKELPNQKRSTITRGAAKRERQLFALQDIAAVTIQLEPPPSPPPPVSDALPDLVSEVEQLLPIHNEFENLHDLGNQLLYEIEYNDQNEDNGLEFEGHVGLQLQLEVNHETQELSVVPIAAVVPAIFKEIDGEISSNDTGTLNDILDTDVSYCNLDRGNITEIEEAAKAAAGSINDTTEREQAATIVKLTKMLDNMAKRCRTLKAAQLQQNKTIATMQVVLDRKSDDCAALEKLIQEERHRFQYVWKESTESRLRQVAVENAQKQEISGYNHEYHAKLEEIKLNYDNKARDIDNDRKQLSRENEELQNQRNKMTNQIKELERENKNLKEENNKLQKRRPQRTAKKQDLVDDDNDDNDFEDVPEIHLKKPSLAILNHRVVDVKPPSNDFGNRQAAAASIYEDKKPIFKRPNIIRNFSTRSVRDRKHELKVESLEKDSQKKECKKSKADDSISIYSVDAPINGKSSASNLEIRDKIPDAQVFSIPVDIPICPKESQLTTHNAELQEWQPGNESDGHAATDNLEDDLAISDSESDSSESGDEDDGELRLEPLLPPTKVGETDLDSDVNPAVPDVELKAQTVNLKTKTSDVEAKTVVTGIPAKTAWFVVAPKSKSVEVTTFPTVKELDIQPQKFNKAPNVQQESKKEVVIANSKKRIQASQINTGSISTRSRSVTQSKQQPLSKRTKPYAAPVQQLSPRRTSPRKALVNQMFQPVQQKQKGHALATSVSFKTKLKSQLNQTIHKIVPVTEGKACEKLKLELYQKSRKSTSITPNKKTKNEQILGLPLFTSASEAEDKDVASPQSKVSNAAGIQKPVTKVSSPLLHPSRIKVDTRVSAPPTVACLPTPLELSKVPDPEECSSSNPRQAKKRISHDAGKSDSGHPVSSAVTKRLFLSAPPPNTNPNTTTTVPTGPVGGNSSPGAIAPHLKLFKQPQTVKQQQARGHLVMKVARSFGIQKKGHAKKSKEYMSDCDTTDEIRQIRIHKPSDKDVPTIPTTTVPIPTNPKNQLAQGSQSPKPFSMGFLSQPLGHPNQMEQMGLDANANTSRNLNAPSLCTGATTASVPLGPKASTTSNSNKQAHEKKRKSAHSKVSISKKLKLKELFNSSSSSSSSESESDEDSPSSPSSPDTESESEDRISQNIDVDLDPSTISKTTKIFKSPLISPNKKAVNINIRVMSEDEIDSTSPSSPVAVTMENENGESVIGAGGASVKNDDSWDYHYHNCDLVNEAKGILYKLLDCSITELEEDWNRIMKDHDHALLLDLPDKSVAIAIHEALCNDWSDIYCGTQVNELVSKFITILANMIKETCHEQLANLSYEFLLSQVLPNRFIKFNSVTQLDKVGRFYGMLVDKFAINQGIQNLIFNAVYWRPPEAFYLTHGILRVNATRYNNGVFSFDNYELKERVALYCLNYPPALEYQSLPGCNQLRALCTMALCLAIPMDPYQVFVNNVIEEIKGYESAKRLEEASEVLSLLWIFWGHKKAFDFIRQKLAVLTTEWSGKLISDGVYAAIVRSIGSMFKDSHEIFEEGVEPIITFLELMLNTNEDSVVLKDAYENALMKVRHTQGESVQEKKRCSFNWMYLSRCNNKHRENQKKPRRRRKPKNPMSKGKGKASGTM